MQGMCSLLDEAAQPQCRAHIGPGVGCAFRKPSLKVDCASLLRDSMIRRDCFLPSHLYNDCAVLVMCFLHAPCIRAWKPHEVQFTETLKNYVTP